MPRKPKAETIRAAAAAEPTTLHFTAPVELQAAKGETAKPSFEIVAYTGGPMNVAGFYSPVIVEFSGVKTATNEIPILLDHDPAGIVGQATTKVDTAAIRVSGDVMGQSAEATKVVALAKDGFKWKASIGANIQRREFLEPGRKANVNGREVSGPLIIARETLLQEVSFVAIGADAQTSAAVAASQPTGKGTNVDPKFKAWLEANGYQNTENLTAQQLKPLEAAWKAETTPPPTPMRNLTKVVEDATAEAAYYQTIADITARFLSNEMRGAPAEDIARVKTLAEAAVAAKWSEDRYENELLKATRPATTIFRAPPNSNNHRLTDRVIEAALCMQGRLSDVEKQYDEPTLQAAHSRFKNGVGLRQLLLLCAESNGYRGDYSSEVTIDVQRAAFGMLGPQKLQADGFSTNNISNILSNVANKFLRQGWNSVDGAAVQLAKVRPVKDFKQVTIVSLTGDLIFQQLGPTGEIKHGTVGETVYTNQANTYARMLAITRTDIINDDTGALTDVPFKLGRGAALKLNDIFWTPFLAAEANGFFAAGKNNILTGPSDMTLAGLAGAEALFLNQTDPDGNPLGVQPAIIVCPIALWAAARTLMTAERLITGATGVTQGDANIWRDRFKVVSSPYLGNSTYTGFSLTKWYLIADPAVLPFMEIAALNGRVEPIVQQADADFNVLGIQMRGFADIGVAVQEYRAAVKCSGTPT